jgi:tetrapyrrole methylase family protein/MazG family protein
MGVLTIVGLGPGDPGHLTREAWSVLEEADEVWLRTERHPTVEGLPTHLVVRSFDHLYETAEAFSVVYHSIVDQVLRLARRPNGVVYAVPGHPMVGESTVQLARARAAEDDIPVRLVEGLSFVEPTLAALGLDALSGLQICDALDLAAAHHPPLTPDLPALVGQLYSRTLASDVKLTLMNQYPDQHQVTLIDAAGTVEQRLVELPLYALDRRDDLAHLSTLYVPPLEGVSSFEGLQETVAHLRAPEGCPWDREQTHESLRAALLEETYETAAAIDADDLDALREELGDLLLQVVLHAQIAAEAGEFKMAQVIAGIDAKLKHRHPHVWGDWRADGVSDVLHHWEDLKREEKSERRSVLDGVPPALPALQQADTYSRRAVQMGFDWTALEGVVDKVHEELAELKVANTPQEREAELGDLLFSVVNWARWLELDPEVALRKANARFARRFRWMERMAQEAGRELPAMSSEELEHLWREAKLKEAQSKGE